MWELSPSLGSRVGALASPPPFEAVTDSIRDTMTLLCKHENRCEIDTRFSRAIYCLQVARDLFDLFFNSRDGYRGWYYRSPFIGLEMNAAFIDSLRPALVGSGPLCDQPGIDAGDSLRCVSAKVWLAEVSKGICCVCSGEWSPPQDGVAEILNGRWESADHHYAKYGRKAPYLTKIRVFGGFIDAAGHELIPADKRCRAEDIHRTGWS